MERTSRAALDSRARDLVVELAAKLGQDESDAAQRARLDAYAKSLGGEDDEDEDDEDEDEDAGDEDANA